MPKLYTVLVMLLFFCITSYAQGNKKTAIIKGRLINKATREPFTDATITIADLKVFATSDGDGNFTLSEIPYGSYNVVISGYNVRKDSMNVNVNGPITDLKNINILSSDAGADPENVKIPTIALEGNVAEENSNVITQTGSELVFANEDPFVYTAAYIFGYYRFEPRNLYLNQNEIEVNGIPINDPITGNTSTSQLGLAGLTDIFHGREITYGIRPSDYTFGGINGSTYFAITAADQRKGTDITYTNSDRTYNHRIMLTESSGLMKNGWAYSFSGSRRWAGNGYVPGTSFDGYAYYAAVSKVKKKHQFDLTALGSPTTQGRAAYETKEADSLAGSHYYNADWGYQNGAVRNFNTQHVFQPMFIADYVYKPSSKTKWTTSLGYQFGKLENPVMEYSGENPLPDYYQKMPSYYLTMVPPQPAQADSLAANFKNNKQIDWNGLYYRNSSQAVAANYLWHRVSDMHKWTLNENVAHTVNEHLNLFGGFTFVHEQTEYYGEVSDLLGADYALNVNNYISVSQQGNYPTSNNINNRDSIVGLNGKIDHDYQINSNNGKLWGQAVATYNKFELFAAVFADIDNFSRDGFYKNGLFANNSYGTSRANNFFNYGIKGGVTYKVDARNFFFLDASYITNPPTVNNTYISPGTRDFTVNNPTTEKTQSMELGYQLKSPGVSVRILGYVTDTKDATQISRFYDDDNTVNSTVNYVMQNIATRSIGVELSGKVKVLPMLDIVGVASVGQAFYTNRPTVAQYADNDPTLPTLNSLAYIKNYYLGNGPQSAYTAGLNFHPKRSWYVNLNFNYFDHNYVSVNPDRRISQVIESVPSTNTTLLNQIFDQEELPAAFTVDLRAGYTVQLSRRSKAINRFSHRAVMIFSGNINNLLNNTNIINSGYEQLRFNYQTNNPAEFANKYLYGYGINYAVQVALRF